MFIINNKWKKNMHNYDYDDIEVQTIPTVTVEINEETINIREGCGEIVSDINPIKLLDVLLNSMVSGVFNNILEDNIEIIRDNDILLDIYEFIKEDYKYGQHKITDNQTVS
jgi:hypothetical protein